MATPGGAGIPPGRSGFFFDGDQQLAQTATARKLSRVIVAMIGIVIAILIASVTMSDVAIQALIFPSKKPSTNFPLVLSSVVGRTATSGSLLTFSIFPFLLVLIFFAVLGVAIWMCKKRWLSDKEGKVKHAPIVGHRDVSSLVPQVGTD